MKKRHLSFTQINMFLRCPRQYAYRYEENLKLPPSGALIVGRSLHKAVELNYKQKVQTEIDLPVETVRDCFSDAFERAFSKGVMLDDGEDSGQLKDMGIAITTLHHTAIAPKVRPLMVEQEFNLDLGEGFPFTFKGVWDVIERDGTIADNKSYSKTPSQADLDRDLQFSAYSTAYRAIHQRIEPGLRMDCVVKTKTPKTVQLHTKRSNEDCKWFLGLVEKVGQAILSGIFPPNPTGYLCSPKWCGYWGLCRK